MFQNGNNKVLIKNVSVDQLKCCRTKREKMSLTLNSVPKMSQLKSEKRSRGGEMLFALCVQIACMKSAHSCCLNVCRKQKAEKTPVHTMRNFGVCACAYD